MRTPDQVARDEASVEALLGRPVAHQEILVDVLVEVVAELARRVMALEARHGA